MLWAWMYEKRIIQGNPSSHLVLDTELAFCIILSKYTLYLLIISCFKVLEYYSNWMNSLLGITDTLDS